MGLFSSCVGKASSIEPLAPTKGKEPALPSSRAKDVVTNQSSTIMDDAPPAYTESPAIAMGIPDTQLSQLFRYDTVFIVDDSYSMNEPVRKKGLFGKARGVSRWEVVRNSLMAYAPIAAFYDSDGIDIHFLHFRPERAGVKNTHLKWEPEILALFKLASPRDDTPLGEKLAELLSPYLDEIKKYKGAGHTPRPRNYIILTDGEPTTPDAATDAIEGAIEVLVQCECNKRQLGLQFVQIGDDPKATKFLKYLDDYRGFDRDIVDTVKDGDSHFKRKVSGTKNDTLTQKLLLGGISRAHDNEEI